MLSESSALAILKVEVGLSSISSLCINVFFDSSIAKVTLIPYSGSALAILEVGIVDCVSPVFSAFLFYLLTSSDSDDSLSSLEELLFLF